MLSGSTIISLTISLTILHMNLDCEVQWSGKRVDFFSLPNTSTVLPYRGRNPSRIHGKALEGLAVLNELRGPLSAC